MHIRIFHETHYAHEFAASYAIQHMLLTPDATPAQTILEWSIEAPGFEGAARLVDGFGNIAHLCNQTKPEASFAVRVDGLVQTTDTGGIIGRLPRDPVPGIFLRQTEITRASGPMLTLARAADGTQGTIIAKMHALMEALSGVMRFDVQNTDSDTTAAQAFELGEGVCQDFAHVMIGAARAIDIPARYVTGYLVMDDGEVATANHAWAEIWDRELGWIGFDAANRICPTERYVRLAAAFDAASAAPIRGIRRGAGPDELRVSVGVYAESAQ
ncbi:MAG TPA: transglutaminase family protein [Devosiaceae bacterium]|nr:transglutaminase family protein [Devosiaceae bacterium]